MVPLNVPEKVVSGVDMEKSAVVEVISSKETEEALLYEVTEVTGKGLGLVAARDLQPGGFDATLNI